MKTQLKIFFWSHAALPKRLMNTVQDSIPSLQTTVPGPIYKFDRNIVLIDSVIYWCHNDRVAYPEYNFDWHFILIVSVSFLQSVSSTLQGEIGCRSPFNRVSLSIFAQGKVKHLYPDRLGCSSDDFIPSLGVSITSVAIAGQWIDSLRDEDPSCICGE